MWQMTWRFSQYFTVVNSKTCSSNPIITQYLEVKKRVNTSRIFIIYAHYISVSNIMCMIGTCHLYYMHTNLMLLIVL